MFSQVLATNKHFCACAHASIHIYIYIYIYICVKMRVEIRKVTADSSFSQCCRTADEPWSYSHLEITGLADLPNCHSARLQFLHMQLPGVSSMDRDKAAKSNPCNTTLQH